MTIEWLIEASTYPLCVQVLRVLIRERVTSLLRQLRYWKHAPREDGDWTQSRQPRNVHNQRWIDLYLTRVTTTPLNGSSLGSLTEGLRVIERFFRVPLDYSDPSGEKITVFARQTIPINKAKTSEEQEKLPISACIVFTIASWRLRSSKQCCICKAHTCPLLSEKYVCW